VDENLVYLVFPLWIPGFAGSLAIGDITVDGDDGDGDDGPDWPGQLFDSASGLEFFFLGRVVVNRRAWSVLADAFGGSLQNSVVFKLTDGTLVDTKLRPLMARACVGYRLGRWPLDERDASQMTLRAYIGARYYRIDVKLKLTEREYPLEVRENWADPILGAHAHFETGPHWRFAAWTDIGGFGAGSRFAWWSELDAGYRFTDWFNLRVGYTLMYVDYRDPDRNQPLDLTMWLSGPNLTLGFVF
jgi:hypothetical protein